MEMCRFGHVWKNVPYQNITESWDAQKPAGRRQSENRPLMFGVRMYVCMCLCGFWDPLWWHAGAGWKENQTRNESVTQLFSDVKPRTSYRICLFSLTLFGL